MASIAPPAHTRDHKTTDDWITPPWIIEAFGPFDLDPCACIPQPWPCAKRNLTIEDDGLQSRWEQGEFVWMNPPYGRLLGAWLNRMALHGNGLALVFARTETKAFFEGVWPHARSIMFLRGRVHFHRPDGSKATHNSGGPSVLIAYGYEATRRLEMARSTKVGAFVYCK